jgi:hypothetical protein
LGLSGHNAQTGAPAVCAKWMPTRWIGRTAVLPRLPVPVRVPLLLLLLLPLPPLMGLETRPR